MSRVGLHHRKFRNSDMIFFIIIFEDYLILAHMQSFLFWTVELPTAVILLFAHTGSDHVPVLSNKPKKKNLPVATFISMLSKIK